jgi:electron transfer flavoprotein beta subunit
VIVAALKWVDLRPEVDPLTGALVHDERGFGHSPADQAALEWALRVAACWDDHVVAVTVGPAGADRGLRDALAAGAVSAVRVDLPSGPEGRQPSSAAVAAALAPLAAGADLVCCGDASLDRGSGALPAHLADRLGVASALGLVGVEIGGRPRLEVERRLDRGRRERLAVTGPAVVSVEGGTASLRRASLPGVLAARLSPVELVAPSATAAGVAADDAVHRRGIGPYRPRARVLPGPDSSAPARERVLHLTGPLGARQAPRALVAEPVDAAEAILAQLRAWGYLDEGDGS